MRRVQIPGTELKVSPICLGTVEFGANIPEAQAFELLDAFVAEGGNFIDSALIYSDWQPGPKSINEKTVGRWLTARSARDQIVLATKGAHPELKTMQVSRLAPEDISGDVDKSLTNLQTDVIDLYWLHRDDRKRPVSEIIDTLQAEVEAGKIRYYGCSNWQIDRIAEAQAYAKQKGILGFAANQPMWSLAKVNFEKVGDQTTVALDDKGLAFHRRTGMPLNPYSAQAHGFFTKMEAQGRAGLSKNDDAWYINESNLRRLERVKELAQQYQTTVGAVALSYLCSQPFVTVPIVGCKRLDHLHASLEAAEVILTNDEVAQLATM
jgi:aryl-alcohol dehydrogenase-like predicted oxidoreductase